MTTPQVSVLLPAYNHCRFVSQAIDSVLQQSFRDYEFIVVDDGSTDGTIDLLRSYQNPRLRLIEQANQGIAGALNTAFLASRGEYIAIMNDDDLWLPGKLQTQVGILAQRPDIDVTYAQAQVIAEDGEVLPQKLGHPGQFPESLVDSLLFEDCICPITVLLRRSAINEVGLWDRSLPGVDDWDMWLRLACSHRFYFVNEVVAYYRIHPQNYSGIQSPFFADHQERRVKVLDKFFREFPCLPNRTEMRTVSYRNLYTKIGLQWLNRRGWRKGVKAFRQALDASPHPQTVLWILKSIGVHTLMHVDLGRRLLASIADWRLAGRTQA